jgi:hypothetical protein
MDLITDFLHSMAFMFHVAAIASFVTLGAAVACRSLKWSPINITINVTNKPSEQA